MASVSQVRELSDGHVLVNDNVGRRLLMFDSTFTTVRVVADTTNGTTKAYGAAPGGLIAYRADSTLFVASAMLALEVIDPHGTIVREMAVPQAGDVTYLLGGPFGTPGFDRQGQLVYRARLGGPRRMSPTPLGKMDVSALTDSAMVMRVDLATRKRDTVAKFAVPVVRQRLITDADGHVRIVTTTNPMPWTDAWALLPDGTVAIVHGQEYRVDFIAPDGHIRAAPKVPFDWQRMADEDKAAALDSARVALARARALQLARVSVSTVHDSAALQHPSAMTVPRETGVLGGAGYGPMIEFVPLTDLPDYRPVFHQGAVRADADGNIWIRTSEVVNGGVVYDVINEQGVLIDRIQVPPGRIIIGFGARGAIYMAVDDGATVKLELTRTVVRGK